MTDPQPQTDPHPQPQTDTQPQTDPQPQPQDEPQTWYALMHTPGPALAGGQAVFDHPGIAGHFSFLQQLAASGALIAAGPLTDVSGEGMTVIRAGSLDEARQLAEQQDQSVVSGVLAVTVRPWQVVMAPLDQRD